MSDRLLQCHGVEACTVVSAPMVFMAPPGGIEPARAPRHADVLTGFGHDLVRTRAA